jgi:hypothetical protein
MAFPKMEKAAPALAGSDPLKSSRLGGATVKTDKSKPKPGQLVDRYGHVHSEAIFRNWSPAAIKALGVRRIGEGEV